MATGDADSPDAKTFRSEEHEALFFALQAVEHLLPHIPAEFRYQTAVALSCMHQLGKFDGAKEAGKGEERPLPDEVRAMVKRFRDELETLLKGIVARGR